MPREAEVGREHVSTYGETGCSRQQSSECPKCTVQLPYVVAPLNVSYGRTVVRKMAAWMTGALRYLPLTRRHSDRPQRVVKSLSRDSRTATRCRSQLFADIAEGLAREIIFLITTARSAAQTPFSHDARQGLIALQRRRGGVDTGLRNPVAGDNFNSRRATS